MSYMYDSILRYGKLIRLWKSMWKSNCRRYPSFLLHFVRHREKIAYSLQTSSEQGGCIRE
jgi:hypothetical protein